MKVLLCTALVTVAGLSASAHAAITCTSDTLVALGPQDAGGFVNVSEPTYAGGPVQFASGVGVKKVVASGRAFCAITDNDVAIAWGDEDFGGLMPGSVTDVSDIVSNGHACVAHKSDGTIVAWGDNALGGDLTGSGITAESTVVSELHAVGEKYFLAILQDGTAVTWGATSDFVDQVAFPAAELNGLSIAKIASRGGSFPCIVALTTDGNVITWGHSYGGGNSSGVDFGAGPVQDVFSTSSAGAAIRNDGTLVCWGSENAGGDCSGVTWPLGTITKVVSTNSAFAALTSTGGLVSWGPLWAIDDFDEKGWFLDQGNVTDIYSNHGAFTAVNAQGAYISWGVSGAGGSIYSGVEVGDPAKVVPNTEGFAMLGSTGGLKAWGDNDSGQSQLTAAGITLESLDVFATNTGFAAALVGGGLVTWGDATLGESGWDGQTCGVELLAANNEVLFVKLVDQPDTKAPTSKPTASPSMSPTVATAPPTNSPIGPPTTSTTETDAPTSSDLNGAAVARAGVAVGAAVVMRMFM